jgi:hypothetical protein
VPKKSQVPSGFLSAFAGMAVEHKAAAAAAIAHDFLSALFIFGSHYKLVY